MSYTFTESPLCLNGIGVSSLGQVIRNSYNFITLRQADFDVQTQRTFFILKLRGKEVKIYLPISLYECSPHTLIKELHEFIIKECKQQYPEEFLI